MSRADSRSADRLGAFVMTFDRPEVLRHTLAELIAQTRPPETILVIDNGSSMKSESIARALHPQGVRYHAMPGNSGPAGAAAHGLRQLADRGYEWIYWGDDDDPPETPDTLERLLRLGSQHQREAAAVGASGTRWNWRTGRVERLPDEALSGLVDVDVIAGSSQLMVSATAVRAVGLPDARLFFGFEEPEYCLRLRCGGYRLLVDGDLMYSYREVAGRLDLARQRPLRPRHEYRDIWRQYYSTRNYIFAMRQSFERPDLALREVARAAARALSSWGHGLRYGGRFSRLQLRAVRDGYAGRLGCTVEPNPKAG